MKNTTLKQLTYLPQSKTDVESLNDSHEAQISYQSFQTVNPLFEVIKETSCLKAFRKFVTYLENRKKKGLRMILKLLLKH